MALHLRNCASRQFVRDVVKAVECIAPLKLADSSWDNVGLIAESPLPVNERTVLVTNDLSTAVVEEAVRKKVSMIISYHPPWFRPAKSLSLDGPLSGVAICVAHGISIYSPHTALDSIVGGINDWICDAFRDNIKSCKAIVPSTVPGFEKSGFGRVIELSTPISLLQAILLTKSFLGLSTVRYAKRRDCADLDDATIRTIAVCAGSGGSVFTGTQADLFLTGELTHHQTLDLCDKNNAHVVLTEHSNCERGYLRGVFVPALQSRLDALDDSVRVLFSESDADPIAFM